THTLLLVSLLSLSHLFPCSLSRSFSLSFSLSLILSLSLSFSLCLPSLSPYLSLSLSVFACLFHLQLFSVTPNSGVCVTTHTNFMRDRKKRMCRHTHTHTQTQSCIHTLTHTHCISHTLHLTHTHTASHTHCLISPQGSALRLWRGRRLMAVASVMSDGRLPSQGLS